MNRSLSVLGVPKFQINNTLFECYNDGGSNWGGVLCCADNITLFDSNNTNIQQNITIDSNQSKSVNFGVIFWLFICLYACVCVCVCVCVALKVPCVMCRLRAMCRLHSNCNRKRHIVHVVKKKTICDVFFFLIEATN